VEFLKLCLSVLIKHIKDDSTIEILVVNNNSRDATECYLKKICIREPRVSYVNCLEQGLSYARNLAVENSKSTWLSFVDDDAYVDANWLKENKRMIATGKFDAFGGAYLPWFKDGRKDWFLSDYESNLAWMPNKSEYKLRPGDPYFSGGNCTFRIEALRLTGNFKSQLGMVGNKQRYGEEIHIQRALALQGYSLGFTKDMLIYHYTPMHKQSIFWAAKRAFFTSSVFWDIYDKSVTLKNLTQYTKLRTERSLSMIKQAFRRDLIETSPPCLKRFFYEAVSLLSIIGLWFGAIAFYLKEKRSKQFPY
jgi:glycosyltransferase involved in cell wall biosynthesis